jgi:hypothetical protein
MKLKPLASNMTEVEMAKATILFSYSTPVAACMNDGTGFIRTSKKWSVTTSRHINKWLNGAKARTVPQSEIDALA